MFYLKRNVSAVVLAVDMSPLTIYSLKQYACIR